MLALTYNRQIVLALFLDSTGRINPSAADIERFDAGLRVAWDAILTTEMVTAHINNDQTTKSIVLQYSVGAPGGSFQEQAHAGCQYFLNTNGL